MVSSTFQANTKSLYKFLKKKKLITNKQKSNKENKKAFLKIKPDINIVATFFFLHI